MQISGCPGGFLRKKSSTLHPATRMDAETFQSTSSANKGKNQQN